MEANRKKLEFEVFPLWKFMTETFGINDAFQNYGPYKGAGIVPNVIDKNNVEVTMDLSISNTNYVGAHFGGSLYSMCDPFYMFIMIWNLGEEYIVWDKSARIEFVNPGKGRVRVLFHVSVEEIEQIKVDLQTKKKMNKMFYTEILDEKGKIVAKLEKEIYIRRK
jgi:acyl-coenzyme A thioesterase PaaI-like protein